MSSYMADLDNVLSAGRRGGTGVKIEKKGSNLNLDMTDFVQLMITELTNQGIDESVDTSDMLNQMIQMQMVETMANLTDASIMSYAASLVNKEVTVGKYDSEGNLQELPGTVTGTGTKDGQQVVFINDEYYYLSEIMAVGRLPEAKEEDKVEGAGETEIPEKTNETRQSPCNGASRKDGDPDV